MAHSRLLVVVVFLLRLISGQVSTIRKTEVEGLSLNVDILCDLDRQFHPLYWDIQGRVYSLYTIPEIFIIRGHEAITLPTVDRRMDGWRFQCFTIDPRDEYSWNPGQITILSVIYSKSANLRCVCVCVRVRACVHVYVCTCVCVCERERVVHWWLSGIHDGLSIERLVVQVPSGKMVFFFLSPLSCCECQSYTFPPVHPAENGYLAICWGAN